MIDFKLRVISRHEQINRLLVVIHHENIHELASFRFLDLNLEWQNIFFFYETMI